MIFMNHKIKAFLVAIISMKAITTVACPLRASAQRNQYARKQQIITTAKKKKKGKVLDIQAFFVNIKITL